MKETSPIMKRVLLAVALAGFVVGCGKKKDYSKLKLEEVFHPYDVKSGYIKYKVSGDEEGYEELWWDDYGLKTHKHRSVVSVKFGRVPIEGWDIGTKEWLYSYGRRFKRKFIKKELRDTFIPDSIIGSARPNNLFLILKGRWDKLSPEQKNKLGPKIEKFAKELQLGIVYKGMIQKPNQLFVKKIAGKKADVYKVKGKDIRLFIYKGIPLGWEVLTESGSQVFVEAVEVKENIKVPPDKFGPLQGPNVRTVIYTDDSVAVQQEKILINEMLKTYLPELFEF